jgi:hypothetical protein
MATDVDLLDLVVEVDVTVLWEHLQYLEMRSVECTPSTEATSMQLLVLISVLQTGSMDMVREVHILMAAPNLHDINHVWRISTI